MSQPLLQLVDVDLRFGGRLVLDQVSLSLEQGEILTVIGPNGAGKTTLLRVALGLQRATCGESILQRGITVGYMPQKLFLDPTFPLTVRRFLSLACGHRRERIAALLEEVGAARVLDDALGNLSGGEMQRVLLARALAREPQLLVLDEPVQGVDVYGQSELYRLIGRIRRERNCAILMVSHDLHLVMAATDRVLCLNRHICCSGTPEAVTQDPAYSELFGARTIEQLAVYSHDQDHHHDHCASCPRSPDHAG